MASDWPGQPAYFRHPHRLANCPCSRYFTPRNEPPPYYVSQAFPTQLWTELEFLEHDLLLVSDTIPGRCRWIHNDPPEVGDEYARSLILEIAPDTNPEQFRIETRVSLVNNLLTIFYEYRKFVELRSWATPKLRGEPWQATFPQWEKVIDTHVPDKPAVSGPVLFTPYACIP